MSNEMESILVSSISGLLLLITLFIGIPISCYVILKAYHVKQLRRRYLLEIFAAGLVLAVCTVQVPVQVLSLMATFLTNIPGEICVFIHTLETFTWIPFEATAAAIIFNRTQQLTKSKLNITSLRHQLFVIVAATLLMILHIILMSVQSTIFHEHLAAHGACVLKTNSAYLELVRVILDVTCYLSHTAMIPASWMRTIRYITKPKIKPSGLLNDQAASLTTDSTSPNSNVFSARASSRREHLYFCSSSDIAKTNDLASSLNDDSSESKVGSICNKCNKRVARSVNSTESSLSEKINIRRIFSTPAQINTPANGVFDDRSSSSSSQNRIMKYMYKPPQLRRSMSHNNIPLTDRKTSFFGLGRHSKETSVNSSISSLSSSHQHADSSNKKSNNDEYDSEFDSIIAACKKEIEESDTDTGSKATTIGEQPRFQFTVQRPSTQSRRHPVLRHSFSDNALNRRINRDSDNQIDDHERCTCKPDHLPTKRKSYDKRRMIAGISFRMAILLILSFVCLPDVICKSLAAFSHAREPNPLISALTNISYVFQTYILIFHNHSIVKLLKKPKDQKVETRLEIPMTISRRSSVSRNENNSKRIHVEDKKRITDRRRIPIRRPSFPHAKADSSARDGVFEGDYIPGLQSERQDSRKMSSVGIGGQSVRSARLSSVEPIMTVAECYMKD